MTEPDTVMDPHDTRPGIPDDDLHAWLDGRLPEDQRHAVDDRLAHDPAARDTVAAYRCLLYTSPSPRDRTRSRMPSSA